MSRNVSQQTRLIKLETPLGKDGLIVTSLKATEGLSKPFNLVLNTFSKDTSIRSTSLIGKPISIEINDGCSRLRFNGLVYGFTQGMLTSCSMREYELLVAPWFLFLKKKVDCRIFQHKTVIEIFKTICKEKGFYDFDLSLVRKEYTTLNYCVQYNETAFDFLSRILEEAGIFYFFSHFKVRHVMKLCDNQKMLPTIEEGLIYSNGEQDKGCFETWKETLRFRAPCIEGLNKDIIMSQNGFTSTMKEQCAVVGPHGSKNIKRFYYSPGVSSAQEFASSLQRKMKVQKWQSHKYTASGNVLGLYAGSHFNLVQHKDEKQKGSYLVVDIQHEVLDNTHLSSLTEENKPAQYYKNTLTCISLYDCYMPPEDTAKPRINGVQTAKVVGPKDQEIYTDQYGRIKVQFLWDKYGVSDERSSCWLSVGQLQAGGQWGAQFIPRVGQEVLVDFLHGNPDLPVVRGALYNAKHKPPFAIPENKNITGIKTHTLNCESSDKGNQLFFDDTQDKEELHIHAQRDLSVEVLGNLCHTIGGGEKVQVDNDYLMKVLSGNAQLNAKEICFKGGGSELIINKLGVTMRGAASSGGKVRLLARGVGKLKPVARVGDVHECPKQTNGIPHKGGPLLKGSDIAKANSQSIARVGDDAHCEVDKNTISEGVSSILVDGKPIAKLHAKLEHGGVITTGSPNVFVGEKK